MNIRELRGYMRKNKLEDRWWLKIENNILDYPVRLLDLAMRKGSLKGKSVSVRHHSEFKDPEDIEVWEDFEFNESFILRPKQASILAEPIEDHPMESLEEFRLHMPTDAPKQVVEGIYEQLNNERKSLMEIQKQLEQTREDLASKEQEITYREKYLEQCEDMLMNRSYENDKREAEIDQVLDDMNCN